jgi:hypothetical protein
MFTLTAQKGSMYDAMFYFYSNHYQNARKCNLSLSLCEDSKEGMEVAGLQGQ